MSFLAKRTVTSAKILFKIIQARWRIYVIRVSLIGLDNVLSQSN